VNYRGKILTISPTGEGGHRNEYICTAHYADHIEIVPICPGTEGMVFPLIPLSGAGLVGVVFDSRDDADLIRQVKDRCKSVIRGLEEGRTMLSFLFPRSALSGTRQGVQQNLARLESLDGDQPAAMKPPVPSKDSRSALKEQGYSSVLDRAFAEMFGGQFLSNEECAKPMVGENPSHVGKLVFLEIPLECDDPIEQVSGEYIVVGQSPDSLYIVNTCCCLAGTTVLRFPFSNGAGKELLILDEYEDDTFIEEFIERLDDMDTDDYDAIDCDAAETVSRRLKRMLEKKLTDRAKSMMASKPAVRPFNTLGCMTRRECCGV
jgi:hypothetical protein